MSRLLPRTCVTVFVLLQIIWASVSTATVPPAKTQAGTTVRWLEPEIVLQPVNPALHSTVSIDGLRAALKTAAQAWNKAMNHCAVPQVRIGAPRDRDTRIRQDGINVVIVQTHDWCPDRARDPEQCYRKERSAITHLYPRIVPGNSHDGELLEVDVEINSVHYAWDYKGNPPKTLSLSISIQNFPCNSVE